MTINKEHLLLKEDAIKQIIAEAVSETLVGLGFDPANRLAMQADLAFLRKARLNQEDSYQRVKQALITATVPAALYGLWQFIKTQFKQNSTL